jgi:sulfide:quinone oxidoreductase
MERKRIVIIGSSFAGYTAAISLAKRLGDRHQVVVISDSDQFVFIPSLIWLPFGARIAKDISFPLAPIYRDKGISFLHTRATAIDLERRVVETQERPESYDYLLIATGPKPDYASIPGLGPDGGYTSSICNIEHAQKTGEAWKRLVAEPGPVIIGAAQGASCFGAAYEFLFNTHHQLVKKGLDKKCPVTFVTAEPFLGHFGICGFGKAQQMTEYFFKKLGITGITNAHVEKVEPEAVFLKDGQQLPFKFAMIIPRFLGVDAVRNSPGLANAAGFLEVDDAYRLPSHPEVYAAGVAVAVAPCGDTPVPVGVPKTGYLSEEMAKVAAHNIAVAIEGGNEIRLPFASIDAKCILDAGDTGIIMLSDHILEPRKHRWLIPGPEAHWAKIAFEKYFLATRRRAMV